MCLHQRIKGTTNSSRRTQKEGSSTQRKMGERVHAPQDFQALDSGHCDDSLDTDDSEDRYPWTSLEGKYCHKWEWWIFSMMYQCSKPKICRTTVVSHSMIPQTSHSYILSAKNGMRIWHSSKMMKWTFWKSCVLPMGSSIIKARFENGISGWGYKASFYIMFGIELVSYCSLLLVFALVGSFKIVIGLSCRSSTRIE
jgi:hypothetical protein